MPATFIQNGDPYCDELSRLDQLCESGIIEDARTGCLSLRENELNYLELALVIMLQMKIEESAENHDAIVNLGSEIIPLINPNQDIMLFERFFCLAHIKRAMSYTALGNPQAALNDYGSVITAHERFNFSDKTTLAVAYSSIANIQYNVAKHLREDVENKIKHLRMARKNYKLALIADPDYYISSIYLGLVYNELNQPEKSEAVYDQSIKTQLRLFRNQNSLSGLFYKYKSVDQNCLKNLKDKTLFFNNPRFFNDPFDCIVYRNRNYLSNPPFANSLNKIGIFCVSKKPENILMWSHYANSHKGICIGYKLTDDYIKDQNIHFDKIDYRDTYKAGIENFKNTLHEAFYIKNSIWSYEEEYRLMCFNSNSSILPAPKIKEIIFGIQCSEEDQEKVREALKGQDVVYKFAAYFHDDMMKLFIADESINE